MKVLVLGYTGFIGQHLMNYLYKNINYEFHLISSNKKNNSFNNFNFYKIDLKNSEKFRKLIKNLKPDICIDMAWEGIPNYSFINNKNNLESKKKIYKILSYNNCYKIISLGSCWEYGLTYGKVSERKTRIKQINDFGKTKVKILEFLQMLKKNYNTKYIWLRVFFVYGPNNKKNSLIPSCFRDLILYKKFLPNNPKAANDFVYVDDVARAIYLCLNNKSAQGIYNLGSGKLISNIEVINLIAKKIKINFKLDKNKIIKGFYANISKINKKIGWIPKVSLNSGLNKTITFFKNDNI